MKHFIYSVFLGVFFLCPAMVNAQAWNWGLGSENDNNVCESWIVAVDHSGNSYEAGFIANTAGYGTPYFSTYGTDTVFSLMGENQMVIVSADSSGHYRWAIGSQVAYSATPFAMSTDNYGNLYVLGSYNMGSWLTFGGGDTVYNPSGIDMMCFLLKVNSNGNVVWLKNVANEYANNPAGGLSIDNEGFIYVSGAFDKDSLYFGSTILINKDNTGATSDAFIAKYDTAGNPVWSRSIGGLNSEAIFTQACTGGGDIYIGGTYMSDTLIIGTDTLYNSVGTDPYIFVAKYDKDGNPLWARGAVATNSDILSVMATDNWDNLYLGGSFYNALTLGTQVMNGIGSTSFMVKYDKDGNTKWSKNIPVTNCHNVYGIAADNCGNIWTTGGEMGGVFGIPDLLYVTQFDTAGTVGYQTSLQSGGDDQTNIVADNAGHLFVGGDFTNGALVVGPDTLQLNGGSKEALFLLKFSYPYNFCPSVSSLDVADNVTTQPGADIYPNPANDMCTVQTNSPLFITAKVTVYDLMGRLVATYRMQDNVVSFSVSGLSGGTYICRIEGGDKTVITRKLVVIK